MSVLSVRRLREAIVRSLRQQGYSVVNGVIRLPQGLSKTDYRALHELAINTRLEKFRPRLKPYEGELLRYIANGCEVRPKEIECKLVPVQPGSEYEILFRYACLHWSIPVSAGYGRRLRFLVLDESNGKLIGLFGLGDPVYAMQARDQWIGWDNEAKASRLYHVMDAYVLGAVPPYSFLLGGKLVAMLVCSNEVRNVFRRKYYGQTSLIRKTRRPPYLAMVTTTSALGRSSIYNRLRVNGHEYWTSVGFTQGYGEFQFSNGVYDSIRSYADEFCQPTAKHAAWGDGFRNKREVVKKCLQGIGLSTDLIRHGVRREIFAAPLGRNASRFLRGETMRPCFFDWPAQHLFKLFQERWLIARSERMPQYQEYDREQYRLWKV